MWSGIMLAVIATLTLTVPARAQITSISHAWGAGPVSRGALAELRGQNLADRIEGVNLGNMGTTLGGVTVTVDGVPAILWYVSPTLIQFVVPDEVPPTRIEFIPKRPAKVYTQEVKVSGYKTHAFQIYLMDTAPWWNLFDGNLQGIVIAGNPPYLFQVIQKGVIPVSPGARARLTASGARSFRPSEQVFYKILFLTAEGDFLETEAGVWKDPVMPGTDLVTFDVPMEWKGRKGFLFLQTPSNFSEGASVTFE